MSVPKFEVEKFDGSNDFSLWKLKLQALLDQQGLSKAFEGEEKLPESLSSEKKEEMIVKARSTIQLNLMQHIVCQAKLYCTPCFNHHLLLLFRR